jgi:hypothetical protein
MNSVERASGRPVREYSAPIGNHPEWVTRWLEKQGVTAYYFTGDSGMGPTRVYRDDGRVGTNIWAFPVLHLGREASLEEMGFDSIPDQRVHDWLYGISDFVAQNDVIRLVYSHPLGATRYVSLLQGWLAYSQKLSEHGEFRWYTMPDVADFMNDRMKVQWSIDDAGTHAMLVASHARSLARQAWMLPQSQYGKPVVREGRAEIRSRSGYWVVDAKDCTRLMVELPEAGIQTAQK